MNKAKTVKKYIYIYTEEAEENISQENAESRQPETPPPGNMLNDAKQARKKTR